MRKLLIALILILLCRPVFAEVNDISDGDILGKINMSFCAIAASDGGNYDSLQLDGSKNLLVNIASGGLSGTTTPVDNLATPTNAVNSATFLMGYDTSTWDQLRTVSADSGSGLTTGLLATGMYGYYATGAVWKRLTTDVNGSLYVNPGALTAANDNVTAHGFGASSYYDASGTAGASVKGTAGTLLRVIVGTAGTATTLSIYDRADTTCASGTLKAVIDTSAQSSIYFGIAMANGICVVSSTSAPAKLTISYE